MRCDSWGNCLGKESLCVTGHRLGWFLPRLHLPHRSLPPLPLSTIQAYSISGLVTKYLVGRGLTISTNSWHSFKWAITTPWPSGIVPSAPTNRPSCLSESILNKANWYWKKKSKPQKSDEMLNQRRTGYRSRGLKGPPYFRTSFKHFLTVDNLLAYTECLSRLDVEGSRTYYGHQFLWHRLAWRQKPVY